MGASTTRTRYSCSAVWRCIVFGAGLILTNPIARRYMGQLGVGDLASLALPDLDRYLKLRAM